VLLATVAAAGLAAGCGQAAPAGPAASVGTVIPAVAAGDFGTSFSALRRLRGLAALGSGKIGVLLPDTTTSPRYTEFDAPSCTRTCAAPGTGSTWPGPWPCSRPAAPSSSACCRAAWPGRGGRHRA
jgi:D-xylose transport system substrate-binding protein